MPAGAIPDQIRAALATLPPARVLKLYNAGSFFDPRAIPPGDFEAIASLARPFARVIVEAHPALVGDACRRFRDLPRRTARGGDGPRDGPSGGPPEAEQAHDARAVRRRGGVPRGRGDSAPRVRPRGAPVARRGGGARGDAAAIVHAFDRGAAAVSIIPTRSGNGALDALAGDGLFAEPRLGVLEEAHDFGISLARGRVFADLWDLERFPACAACFAARRARLAETNRTQRGGRASRAPRAACGDAGVTQRFDLAVVGAGFAGSLTALIARRLGLSVALVERGRHPRFAIGESSSPLANLLLEELADRYDLPRVRPLAAWGSWRREHPEIGCGLKRGFTFYAHERGRPFAADPERRDQLLVAASPVRRGRRHALVSARLRRVPRARGRGGRRDVCRLDRARDPIAGRRRHDARSAPRRDASSAP